MKPVLACILVLLATAGRAANVAELAPWLDSISTADLRSQVRQLPSPSATDEQGHTLLHHAVCDAPERVGLLLELGVDPKQTDARDATALHRFFRCDHPARDTQWKEVVAALLNAGASPDAADDDGRTPLHAALAMLPADKQAARRYREAAALMIARGADVMARDAAGRTPLHLAARPNAGPLIDRLVAAGAKVNATDDRGRTPLWYAAGGHASTAAFEALLKHGADPAPERGPAPVRRAAADAAWRKVYLLLELGVPAELPEAAATGTLTRALWEDAALPVARALAAAGAVPAKLHEHGGGDLAWRLAELNRPDTLDWLLKTGFELNRLPDSGYPPLFFATETATQLLLERGADPALASAEHGTPVVSFIPAPERFRQSQPHFTRGKVNRLLAAGYPVHHRDRQNKTALERAVGGNRLWLVERLLNAGADPTRTSGEAASLVPLALDTGRLPLIRRLIAAVPDFQRRHPDLLTTYVRQGAVDPAVAELLLVKGLSPNATDKEGNTALHWAARHQDWPTLRLLLNNGGDPGIVNASGCTLECYHWRMPDDLRRRLAPATAAARLTRTSPDARPTAFFALAFSPTLVLFVLVVGWRLYRHQSFWRPILCLVATLIPALILAATLFYDCRSCLLPPVWQLPATALVTLAAFAALTLRPGKPMKENGP